MSSRTKRATTAAYLARVATTPHEYGVHDCALFIAGQVMAVRGYDPAAAFRGSYNNEIGAYRALKRIGSGDLMSTVCNMLDEVDLEKAVCGDVLLLSIGNEIVGAVFDGEYAVVATKNGLERMGLDLAVKAFEI